MNINRLYRGLCLFVCLAMSLSACNLPQQDPEGEPQMDVTNAYLTVMARLTEAALKTPILTPTPTNTLAPSPTAALVTATLRPTSAPTSAPVATCDQASPGNPIDVTIPDDTKLAPGQTFTKTWRLQNSGTCTWAMGEPASVPMPKSVAPAETVDISVDLVAPQTAGTFLGNWKLRNAANAWFGIGPNSSSPFWVRIIVSATTGTVTPASATPSTPGAPTITFTPTPGVQASGRKTLTPGDRLNLDNSVINGGAGEDISWETNANATMSLAPIGAVIGIFGSAAPTLAQCQSNPMAGIPLPQELLSKDLYLCYRTDLGLYGWLQLYSFHGDDNSLVVNFLTWSAP